MAVRHICWDCCHRCHGVRGVRLPWTRVQSRPSLPKWIFIIQTFNSKDKFDQDCVIKYWAETDIKSLDFLSVESTIWCPQNEQETFVLKGHSHVTLYERNVRQNASDDFFEMKITGILFSQRRNNKHIFFLPEHHILISSYICERTHFYS